MRPRGHRPRTPRFLAVAAIAILAACGLASSAIAQATYTWNNASGGDWSDADNWSPPGGPPGPNDTVLFTLDASYTVTLSGAVTVDWFAVMDGFVTLSGSGLLVVTSARYVGDGEGGDATLLVDTGMTLDGGDMTISENSVLEVAAGGFIEAVETHALTIFNFGTVTGEGTIRFGPLQNNGIVRPGGPGIGSLTLSGFVQTESGVLEIGIASATEADAITLGGVSGLWELGGTILVEPLEFSPSPHDEWLIITAPSLSDSTFDVVTAPVDFSVEYGEADVYVRYKDWTHVYHTAIRTEPPSLSNGGAWGDYDDDGDDDMYVGFDGASNTLFQNDGGNARFTDVTVPPLDSGFESSVSLWADYDNDGDLDLFAGIRDQPSLLLHNEGAVFSDVSSNLDIDSMARRFVAAADWADYDADGDLDLYLGRFGGHASALYRNDGGSFVNVSTPLLAHTDPCESVMWVDADNDGDPDLFRTHAFNGWRLLENNGAGGFSTVAGDSAANATAGTAGDFDNDGDLDLYVSRPGTTNALLRNDGSFAFTPLTNATTIDAGGQNHGHWIDTDNDADLDLFVYGSGNLLFRNDGGGTFTLDTSGALAAFTSFGGDAAWYDFDQDGDQDVYQVGNRNRLVMNAGLATGNHWLQVDLVGTSSNHFGVGGRIAVHTGSLVQWRTVRIGSGGTGQSSLTAAFGLGSATSVDSMLVYWPSGGVQKFLPGIDERITVNEDTQGPQIGYVFENVVRPVPTTFNILGMYNQNMSARLMRVGQPDLVASATAPNGDGFTADIDLTGAASGFWDLEISSLYGSDVLEDAVCIYTDAVTLQRATTLTGSEPAIAPAGPDQGRLLFRSERASGSPELFIKDPEAIDLPMPSIAASNELYSPVWSPDGNEIAYLNWNVDEIQRQPASGGSPVTIRAGAFSEQISWSSTGVIAHDDGDNRINSVRVDGSGAAVLTEPPFLFFDGSPTWSPDGSTLAFTRSLEDSELDDVCRMPFDSTSLAPVVHLTTVDAHNDEAAWSPDGRWIAFASSRSGFIDIYVMDANHGEDAMLFQITSDGDADQEPAWDADGTRLFFRRGQDIFIASDLPIHADADNDLVPDLADACPAEGLLAGQIDRDFDGCADPTSSFRNVRFWGADRLPITYETTAEGDPRIGDGSEYTVIDAAFTAWSSVPGTTLAFTADETHAGPANTAAGDGRNTISFSDPDGFVKGFLGFAVVTTVVTDTLIDGRWYRPGEIVDADIVFNGRDYSFSTPTFPGGPNAFDLQSVATHEIGHVAGFAHSGVQTSTMFYVVPPGTSARSLESDDTALAARTYAASPPALNVEGSVLRNGGIAVPGAGVLAVSAANGDSLQMTFTDPDGVYRFFGLTEDYRVYVFPVDGGAEINGLVTAAVNADLAAIAETNFLPEFYDAGETHTDTGTGSVLTTAALLGADVLLTQDLQPPAVVSTTPADGATGVAAITAISVVFDEPIDAQSISLATFLLQEAGGDTVFGTAALPGAGTLLTFTPAAPLVYGGSYTLRVGPVIQDLSGNAMVVPVLTAFSVETQPPVSLTTLSPEAVPAGGNLVIRGTGFSPDTTETTVSFTGQSGPIPVAPTTATPAELLVRVPAGAISGDVDVVSGAMPALNALPVVILPPKPVPRSTPVGQAALSGVPRTVAVGVGDAYAYVATLAGVDILDADPALGTFLDVTHLAVTGGCTGLAAMPDGNRVLVACTEEPRLRVVSTDDANPVTFHTFDVAAARSLSEVPLGIAALPGGSAVLIVYTSRVALHDATPGPTFGNELREWPLAADLFLGDIAVSSSGKEAYATTGAGKLAVLGLGPNEPIVTLLLAGTEPGEATGVPSGTAALGVDGFGTVRLYATRGPELQKATFAGGFRGVTVSPEGDFAYATNFVLNNVRILDLRGNTLLDAGLFETGIDPRDIANSHDGRYLYVATAATPTLEVFDTEVGPIVRTLSPAAGGPNTLITLAGEGFEPIAANNTVTIGGVPHTPLRGDGNSLVVRALPGVRSGPVLVSTLSGLGSNAANYQLVNRPDAGLQRLAHSVPAAGTFPSRLLLSPDGRRLYALDIGGTLLVLQADVTQPDLHRVLQVLTPAQTQLATHDHMVITPDGGKLYVRDDETVAVFGIDPQAPLPVQRLGSVFDAVTGIQVLPDGFDVTPDGSRLWVVSAEYTDLFEVSTANDTTLSSAPLPFTPYGIVVHPLGTRAYVTGPTTISVVDIDPASATFKQVLDSIDPAVETLGASLQFTPGGERLFISGSFPGGFSYGFNVIDTNDGSPSFHDVLSTILPPSGGFGRLEINHSGSVLLWTDAESGTQDVYDPFLVTSGLDTLAHVELPELVFTTSTVFSLDDARLYFVTLPTAKAGRAARSADLDEIWVMDMTGATGVTFSGGLNQVGVAGQPLPAPLIVSVQGPPGRLQGTPVVVRSNVGLGNFGFPDGVLYAAADAGGNAQALYTAVLPGVETAIALLGDAFAFTNFNIVPDTTLAPPQIVAVEPETSEQPGVSTAIGVRFSKAVDPTTVSVASIELVPGIPKPAGIASAGSPTIAGVDGVFTFAEGGKRVVFQPRPALAYSTPYTIVITDAITDLAANVLSNPGAFGFTTASQPAPTLRAADPPAATVGDPVVLSGLGFGATIDANVVRFGNIEVVPLQADPGAVLVQVPAGVTSGNVVVVANGVPSNELSFSIIPTGEPPVNQEIGRVTVPESGQHIAIVPDGSRAYMTSPGSNSIVPIVLATQQAEPAIAVGQHPFGITVSPDGDRVYVSNFYSNTISVVDADASSQTFHKVLATIPVGLNPTGVAAHPDGRSLYAVNYGDSSLTILDTDVTSATLYGARASTSTGSTSKQVTIRPDGGQVILGTGSGLLFVDPRDGSFIAATTTGAPTIDFAISPDGAFVLVLSTGNQLFYVDIQDGSPTQYGARASTSTGSTSKQVTIRPDGGFAYVTDAAGFVQVFEIRRLIGSGASAAYTPPVQILPVGTFDVGENPAGLAFDPRGTGLLLVVNSGSKDVSFIDTFGTPVVPQVFDLIAIHDVQQSIGIDMMLRIPDVSTGVAVAVGSLEYPFTNAEAIAVHPVTGRIYVVDDDTLLELQPESGTGTTIGAIGFSDVDGISFHPQTHVLYGITHGSNRLITIDVQTGDGTLVAANVVSGRRPEDLAFHPDGRLFVLTGSTPRVYQIDLETGEDEDQWTLTGGSSLESLLWSRDGTVLYSAADRQGHKDLVTIDLATRQITFVSPAHSGFNDIEGLAWLPQEISDVLFTVPATGMPPEVADAIPARFAFRPAAPNPFTQGTTLWFDLPRPSPVTLRIYSVDGRLVREVVGGETFPAGRHALRWDGRDGRLERAGSGVYFARIQAGAWQGERKIVRVR